MVKVHIMGPEIGELVPDGLDNDAVIRVKDWGNASVVTLFCLSEK